MGIMQMSCRSTIQISRLRKDQKYIEKHIRRQQQLCETKESWTKNT